MVPVAKSTLVAKGLNGLMSLKAGGSKCHETKEERRKKKDELRGGRIMKGNDIVHS